MLYYLKRIGYNRLHLVHKSKHNNDFISCLCFCTHVHDPFACNDQDLLNRLTVKSQKFNVVLKIIYKKA